MDAFATIRQPSLSLALPTTHLGSSSMMSSKKPKPSSSSSAARKPKQWRSGFVNPLDASGKKRKGRPPRAAYHAAGMLDSYDHRNVQCTDLAKTTRVFLEPRSESPSSSASSSTTSSPLRPAAAAAAAEAKRQLAQEKRRQREGTVASSSSSIGASAVASPPESFASLSSWGSPESSQQLRAVSEAVATHHHHHRHHVQDVERATSVPVQIGGGVGAGIPAIALPKLHPDLFDAFRFPPRLSPPSSTQPSSSSALVIEAPRPQMPLAPAFDYDAGEQQLASLLASSTTAATTGDCITAFDNAFGLDLFAPSSHDASAMAFADANGDQAPLGSLLTPSVSRFMHDLDLLPPAGAAAFPHHHNLATDPFGGFAFTPAGEIPRVGGGGGQDAFEGGSAWESIVGGATWPGSEDLQSL